MVSLSFLPSLLLTSSLLACITRPAFPLQAAAAASQASSGSTVTGRVTNAISGQPIPRALVKIGTATTFSDHQGRFSLEDVPSGSSFIELSKPGYFTSPEQLDPPSVQLSTAELAHSLELHLYPEALLTGSVLAQDGTPFAEIRVSARKIVSSGSGRHLQMAASVQTDSHGDFRMAVPAGDYQVDTQFVATSPETGLTVLPAVAPAGEVATLHVNSGEEQQIQLNPHAGLAHTVTLAVKGLSEDRSMSVMLTGANGASWPMGAQPDPETGELTLRLPAGTYLLGVDVSGSDFVAFGQTRLNIPDHDVSGIALQLSPVAPIPVEVAVDPHATVTAASTPTAQQLGLELVPEQLHGRSLRQESVRLQTRGGRAPAFLPTPGRYHLASSSRSSWYIQSASFGGADVLSGALTVAAGSGAASLQVTVSNVTGSLQGQVTAADAPVSAWIELIPSFPSANSTISLRSAADGTFSAQNLPPGTYAALVLPHRTSADLLDVSVQASLGISSKSFTIQAGVPTTLNLDGRSTP